MKKSLILVIANLLTCLLAACGTFEVGFENNDKSPTATVLDTIQAYGSGNPILTPYPVPQPTRTLAPSEAYPSPGRLAPSKTSPPAYISPTEAAARWRVYRDEYSGVGFALPCWWNALGPPISKPMDRYAVTVRSFDDDFARQHSDKGVWIGGEWPSGAMKIDFYFVPIENPAMKDELAVRAALTNDLTIVNSLQPTAIGAYNGWLAIQSDRDNPNHTGQLLTLRLSPNWLLMIGVAPHSALSNPTIQAILNSLVLSANQAVILPGVEPDTAMIPTPFACAAPPNP